MYATPEELALFRVAVEARRAQAAVAGWRTLPDGRRIRADNVLAGCPKCRRWLWVTPESVPGPCPICNWRRMKDGGMLRAATADEEKAWIQRETEAWKKFLAAKPERDREQREFIKRQIQDGKFK